jgi:hypothetical protein
MLKAQEKRKENIVEYLLYMWQVEDLIRACNLDADELERRVMTQYANPEDVKDEIRRRYAELIDMMRAEGVTEKGHVRININVAAELDELHQRLLKTPRETIYGSLYYKALPSIVQLRAKSGGREQTEIETCLTAVYGFLLLRMQGREVSAETVEGVRLIGKMLACLAAKYNEERL